MLRGISYSFVESFKNLWRNSLMSIASIFAVTATLLILGIIFVIILNINEEIDNMKDNFNQIVVYLKDDVEISRIRELSNEFSRIVGVKKVDYINKDKALEEWKSSWGENAVLLDNLSANPLPNQFLLELKELKYTNNVVDILKNNFLEIENIKFAKEAINKMIEFSYFVRKLGFILILSLLAISTFLITNTIKMAVSSRSKEIGIMKYIGATNWFIRWPFILEGIWIGFLGAIISIVGIYIIYMRFYEYTCVKIGEIYQNSLLSPNIIISDILYIFLILGIGVGALGALNAIRRHLNV